VTGKGHFRPLASRASRTTLAARDRLARPWYSRGWIAPACILLLLASGSFLRGTAPPPLAGRWEIAAQEAMSVPHSFFRLGMTVVEFREDGSLLGLMPWPPDGGRDLMLNARAEYRLGHDGTITIHGTCRHEPECTGTYGLTLEGNTLTLREGGSWMQLTHLGPPGEGVPPRAPGPSASPTPAQP
jgi:hypothetical protein